MEPAGTSPLAVVTGASTGIGRELASQFAAHGFDLLVTADEPEIEAVAEGIRQAGAGAEAVRADLTTVTGVEQLGERIRAAGRPVDALALNAGVGSGGAFVETDLAADLRVVDLNVRSTVHLAKLVVPGMARRGHGRVLLTSSIAATMPGPFAAVYNASKSFVQSFALALREELRGSGVTVTSLMPGPTETEFFRRARMLDTRVGASPSKDDPAEVARDGFAALMRGDERVVSASLSTRAQGRGSRLLPDSVKAIMHRRMAKPGSGRR